MLAQPPRACKTHLTALNRAPGMDFPRRRRGHRLCSAALIAGLLSALAPARTEAASLLPLQTQTAGLLPSGRVELVLGTSYFRNQRFPAFTPPGVIRSQDLVRVPEMGFRIGAGSWAEVQADFDFIYLDEKTFDGSRTEFGNG